MPREPTRVVSWTEKTEKKILVEGAVTVDAPRQHAFSAVSDVLLMPKLYPATKSVKVLSQEQDPAGSVTTTVLEQVSRSSLSGHARDVARTYSVVPGQVPCHQVLDGPTRPATS